MAQFTEEEKMLRRIDKRFSKGVVEYGLIEDGDKILIGFREARTLWRWWSCWHGVSVSINPVFPLSPYM